MLPGLLLVLVAVALYVNDFRRHLHRTPGQRLMDGMARRDRRRQGSGA